MLPGAQDAVYLLILAAGCTIVPFTISLVALRQLTAFATQLAVNLEPVYAILLATMLLNEHRRSRRRGRRRHRERRGRDHPRRGSLVAHGEAETAAALSRHDAAAARGARGVGGWVRSRRRRDRRASQPHVSAEVVTRLLHEHRATGRAIVASAYGESFGVPALFDRSLFDELARLEGAAGAKQVIARHASEATFIPFAGGEVDVDTPDDLPG